MVNSGETYVFLIAQLRQDWKGKKANFAQISKAIVTYTVNVNRFTKTLHVKQS